MDDVVRLRSWSYARQRIGDPAGTAMEALEAVVAVYATHPTAPLALRVRTRSLTPAAYRRIDRDRKGLRMPAMRNTVFLVPRDNAPRIFTAVRPSTAHAHRPLKRLGVSTAEYERFAGRILAAAKEPVPVRALETSVGIKGSDLGTVLRCLRYEGRLVTIAGHSLLMSPHRYVATTAWIHEGLDAGDEAGALRWLVGEYLRAYGPARVEDFAWWAGVAKRSATQALEPHQAVDVGDGLLLHRNDERAFSRVRPVRDAVDLLPKWDAYTMGYAPDGRSRLVHPDVQHLVYTPLGTGLAGDGNPVVLVDGEAAATWTYTVKDGVQVQPFEGLRARAQRRVGEKLEDVARFVRS